MEITAKSQYDLSQEVFAIQIDYNGAYGDDDPCRPTYSVGKQPVKIKHIRITVDTTGKIRIEYYTTLGWYPEHHLFATHADAARYVYDKNN